MTRTFAIYTGIGRENIVVKNIKKVARRCREIISASNIYPGYVNIEVQAMCPEMPRDTQVIVELIPGVVRICGNGSETVSLD